MKYWAAFKDAFFSKLALFIFKNRPAYLENLIRKEVFRLSSELSIKASMAWLDKEKLLHCYCCAQRFGLRRATVKTSDGKSREVYLCVSHLVLAEKPKELAAT